MRIRPGYHHVNIVQQKPGLAPKRLMFASDVLWETDQPHGASRPDAIHALRDEKPACTMVIPCHQRRRGQMSRTAHR